MGRTRAKKDRLFFCCSRPRAHWAGTCGSPATSLLLSGSSLSLSPSAPICLKCSLRFRRACWGRAAAYMGRTRTKKDRLFLVFSSSRVLGLVQAALLQPRLSLPSLSLPLPLSLSLLLPAAPLRPASITGTGGCYMRCATMRLGDLWGGSLQQLLLAIGYLAQVSNTHIHRTCVRSRSARGCAHTLSFAGLSLRCRKFSDASMCA